MEASRDRVGPDGTDHGAERTGELSYRRSRVPPGGAGEIAGRRVLVTGAGGSIGSELCRQILRCGPAELTMLDRDESALHALQLSLTGRAMLDGPELVLADIRDADLFASVVRERRPDVVFHAAALKHLTLLQRFPGEAVKTNVWGTRSVLAACRDVARFVNISTDKAVDPISVLGYSKRIAERLTAHVGADADGTFVSVRFGNVLNSRGSVLTAFRAQLAAGLPLTVTDRRATRFLMSIEEAVCLVLQAVSIGATGESLVLDMGRPVRIVDLADGLARQAGQVPEIVFTGLRPGEKLHEQLFGVGETDDRPRHPLIAHVPVPPLHPDAVRRLDPYAPAEEITAALSRLCRSPGPQASRTPAAAGDAPSPQEGGACPTTMSRSSQESVSGRSDWATPQASPSC